jgi:hemerythrin-like domain-containing protein
VKRDDSLRPLSRQHLVALTTARELRRARSSDGLAKVFLEFWRNDGRDHFRIEEEVLLPTWARHAEVDQEGVTRMLGDHLNIRRYVLDVEDHGLQVEEAHDLGRLLNDHVRFEERELFPRIEEALDPDALGELARAIEKAEAECS